MVLVFKEMQMNFVKSKDASIHITDGNSLGILGHWRMWLEIHSTTWTSLWRIMGSSIEIHEVSSTKNIGCSGCQLRGYVHITCWDRGLSKLQNLVCLTWWSFQSNILVPWTFLFGEPLTQLAGADLTDVKRNRLSRWQSYQQQLQQFWQRWSSDYLQGLQQRPRWLKASPKLQPGALVLLMENNTTPLHWPIAVVTNIQPGKDGIVRVVILRAPKGVFMRPITKICPSPRANDEL